MIYGAKVGVDRHRTCLVAAGRLVNTRQNRLNSLIPGHLHETEPGVNFQSFLVARGRAVQESMIFGRTGNPGSGHIC